MKIKKKGFVKAHQIHNSVEEAFSNCKVIEVEYEIEAPELDMFEAATVIGRGGQPDTHSERGHRKSPGLVQKMNATDIYNHVRVLEGIVATLNRENQNLRENGSGDVATIMKLTAELDDYRRSLRHAVEKELSRQTYTAEDVAGWLRERSYGCRPNAEADRQWLADEAVASEYESSYSLAAWKLGQK